MLEISVTNNATSTLAASIDDSTTEIAVNAVDAGLFPNLNGSVWCPLTIYDATGNYEVVKAVKRTGGIFTVIRGQENTIAKSFPAGTRIDLRITAAIIDELAHKPITDERLPERLQPHTMAMPEDDANQIIQSGIYTTGNQTKNIPVAERGILSHFETENTEAFQDWTAFAGYRRYLRTRKDGHWSSWREITVQPEMMGPWALKAIGEYVALADNIANITQPPRDLHYRYIKLSANDGYNAGILMDEKVSGSAPLIEATAKINFEKSPLNGQIIRLINTERRFLRAGNAGALEDSQNLSHNHYGTTSWNGDHAHTFSRLRFTGRGPDGRNSWSWFYDSTEWTSTNGGHNHNFETSWNGGNEARPRNVGVTYYMRVL